MNRTLIALLAWLPAVAGGATEGLEGRWEGVARIPGRELRLIVDLAPGAAGAWMGSIIVPGLGLKGAPLANLSVSASDLAFDLGGALATPALGPARFSGQRRGAAIDGELKQAGNVAAFSLVRVGPAQVELPPRSTAVSRGAEGRWEGTYELGGYPRRVTITIENRAGSAEASATFVIIGKQTNTLPVDLITEEGTSLRIESQATKVSYEGRLDAERNEIRGAIEFGSLELPLTLRRATGRAS